MSKFLPNFPRIIDLLQRRAVYFDLLFNLDQMIGIPIVPVAVELAVRPSLASPGDLPGACWATHLDPGEELVSTCAFTRERAGPDGAREGNPCWAGGRYAFGKRGVEF